MLSLLAKLLHIRVQGLPKFQYLGKGKPNYRVKHGGDTVTLFNAFYDPGLGCYLYWADANGAKVLIPEKMLEII
jgi:hypothetical protein